MIQLSLYATALSASMAQEVKQFRSFSEDLSNSEDLLTLGMEQIAPDVWEVVCGSWWSCSGGRRQRRLMFGEAVEKLDLVTDEVEDFEAHRCRRCDGTHPINI